MKIIRPKKIKSKIKFILLGMAIFFLFGIPLVKADFSGFLTQLQSMNIPVNTLMTAQGVSRYDLARLLNAVECKDCVNPAQDMVSAYTNTFRSQFVKMPGEDFGDIDYLGGIFNQTKYYYCVAYVGDNAYMAGYPVATSPICAGQFCGSRNVTKAEFIQVGINLVAKYIYKNFSLNWKTAKDRLAGLQTTSYAAQTFTTDDKQIIDSGAQTCGGTPCALKNANEVKTYLKYCMFNLSACAMGGIGTVKQGYWPVAELNLLYKQNIIDMQEAEKEDLNQIMDGKRILQILYNLYKITSCMFNNDYDCDGLDNPHDNCPNSYNPHQTDTDHDGIGDVCDDDIDGDKVKNPIGIVDDNGNFDIHALKGWSGTLDNCLFIVNANQQDSNANGMGDVCDNATQTLSMYIAVSDFKGSAPLTATFEAVTKGAHEAVQRDFGDPDGIGAGGTQVTGNKVTHTFLKPGMYVIKASALGKGSNDASAKTIIIVGGSADNQNALQIKADKIGGDLPLEITFTPSSIGNPDDIERTRNKDSTTITHGDQGFKKIFSASGSFSVGVKIHKGGTIVGVGNFIVGVGKNMPGSLLKANMLNPDLGQKVDFQTTTYGFTPSDINDVQRDFGDGTKTSNSLLMLSHNFTERGTKVVIQTIMLNNGLKLTNFITLDIVDISLMLSYALQTSPNKLNPSSNEKVNFTSTLQGDTITNYTAFLDTHENGNTTSVATLKFPYSSSYMYSNGGIYTPETILQINECQYLETQSTLAVDGQNFCQKAFLNGTLKNYACDMDKDGIPDICDDDIDGDGVKNLIGIIKYENGYCLPDIKALTISNVNLSILQAHYKGICTLDNASFAPNPDQLDLNQDGYGDAGNTGISFLLDQMTNVQTDSDGDGFPDTFDLCPTMKGTAPDGCPKIGTDLTCEGKSIEDVHPLMTPGECNQCPCPIADINANLTNGDNIKAVLRNKEKRIPPYKYSPSFGFEF